MKVAINGFGRIGKEVFKICLGKKVNVVAINDLSGVESAAYLMKHDSVHGGYKGKVKAEKNYLVVDGKKVLFLGESDPTKLPWKKLGVDVVVESTGVFRHREDAMKHITAGAKKVLISAPMKDKSDVTLVPGVNDKALKKSHKLISVASCTTNCTAPIVKVLDDNFKIKFALLSTVHGYTSTQSLIDRADSKDYRRGRAAAVNLIPTSTGASEAVVEALPHLKGKMDGSAIRAPVPDGSIIDLVAEVKKPADIKKINSVFRKAAKSSMKGIIEYSEDDLVSSDIVGNPHSSIYDSKLTKVEGNLIKIFAWYDNEHGYSNRVVDVIKALGRK